MNEIELNNNCKQNCDCKQDNDCEKDNHCKQNNPCEKDSQSIIAFKVFDQCRIQKCISEGPAISAEKCTCIIMAPNEDDDLGRLILPNRPIYIPEIVAKAKIIPDSFETTKIEISSIEPSNFKVGYWDIEIIFTFKFKLQLLDKNMNKFKILCCPNNCRSSKDCNDIQNYILSTVNYIEKVTLCGPTKEGPLIVSDLLFENEPPVHNTPHILVETKEYFLDAYLEKQKDLCLDEIDEIYDEPITYVYIKIGIFMLVKLFQLASILVESKGYSIARPYCDNFDGDCEIFDEISFPHKDFHPPIKK